MKPRKDESEEFVMFWELWRKKARQNDGRGSAREGFNKHVKAGANPMDIVNGAAWYLRSLKDKDLQYIPLVQTWLNRGAYEDFAEMEVEYQERRNAAQRSPEPSANVHILPANHFSNRWKQKVAQ
jgi:hypothetical protein